MASRTVVPICLLLMGACSAYASPAECGTKTKPECLTCCSTGNQACREVCEDLPFGKGACKGVCGLAWGIACSDLCEVRVHIESKSCVKDNVAVYKENIDSCAYTIYPLGCVSIAGYILQSSNEACAKKKKEASGSS